MSGRYPFYVVLLVAADIKNAADNYLERNGYGSNNLKKEIILKSDPDDAAAKAYACAFWCTPSDRTVLDNKAKAHGVKAKCFWSMDRREAKQQALAKIDQWGYRIKPTGV